MGKIDFKKELKHLYNGKVGENVVVDVPSMNFLMIDGKGDPNIAPRFVQAIEALYPVAYTLKFMCKKELGQDYGVMPLEGRFWVENMDEFDADNKEAWLWTLIIMQPPMITDAMFSKAIEQVRIKKKPPALADIRFERLDEGCSAQVMYVGPYADEGPTIKKLHKFIDAEGGAFDGAVQKHHEIYLSDARRTDPSRLKTIIRQPFVLDQPG